MSGFAVVCHLDGRPASAAQLDPLLDAAAWRGPDGRHVHVDGAIAFGFLALHTTAEAVTERQPIVEGGGARVLVFDGRLDDRETLRRELRVSGPDVGDAALVLLAHRAWGDDAAARLLGDFAYVLWDRDRRRLFCVRDVFGFRPFHYWSDGRTFIAASEVAQILAHPDVPRALNEGVIGEHLACKLVSADETLFRGVLRLRAAHSLVVEGSNIGTRAYWRADPARQVRHRDDEEYAEHFRVLFRDAVRDRLRCHRTVMSELSGGLDSSWVVGMAATLQREGQTACPGFETASMVFPGWDCDETPFIESVLGHWGLTGHRTPAEAAVPSLLRHLAGRHLDFPPYPNGIGFRSVMRLARDRGTRVMLTGAGGDDWFWGSYDHLACADLLRQGRPLAFSKALLTAEDPPLRAAMKVARYLVGRRMTGLRRRNVWRSIPDWVDPAFARRIDLGDRLSARPAEWDPQSAVRSQVHATGMSPWGYHGTEIMERLGAECGVERRHPLFDRRLVEFALAIPEEQRHRGSARRRIERRAARPFLPALVADRDDKANFAPPFRHALAACVDMVRPARRLRSVQLGWVKPEALERAYGRATAGERTAESDAMAWPVWMTFGVEFWLGAVRGATGGSGGVASRDVVASGE